MIHRHGCSVEMTFHSETSATSDPASGVQRPAKQQYPESHRERLKHRGSKRRPSEQRQVSLDEERNGGHQAQQQESDPGGTVREG